MANSTLRSVLSAAFAMIAVVCPATAHSPPPVLNPKSYASPSGEYELTVDPSTMYGQGEGLHRLTRAGREVWAKTLPFTLWDAAVTDEGGTVGYAYTHGYHGFPPPETRGRTKRSEWSGYFHIVVIDTKGELRLNERKKRTRSPVLGHDVSYPAASGLFVDPGNDRFVIRMADPDIGQQSETWLVYRLSDGKQVGSFEPGKHMTGADWSWSIRAAQPVSGTTLTLVNWYIVARSGEVDEAKFTLIDADGRPVWTLDRPGEYDFNGDAQAAYQFRYRRKDQTGILDVSRPRQFELWFPAEKARVTFEVQPGPDPQSPWKVSEVGRRDYIGLELPKREEPQSAPVELEHLGNITLRARCAAQHPVRALRDFDFDDRGRLGLVRYEEKGPCVFVLVQPTGEVVGEVPLKGTEDKDKTLPLTAWLTDDRWLVVKSIYGGDAESRAWVLRVGASSLTEIDGFDCPSPKAAAGTGDGGFVVLGTHNMSDELVAFDATGQRRWSVREDNSKESCLFSPEDIAVTRDGGVAVVDNIRGCVQLFDKNGAYLRTINLRRAFGRDPGYLVNVAADHSGGLVIRDFGGSPPVWRLAANDKVTGKFVPEFADGRPFPLRAGVKAAPDGRLWATDGEVLCRLTDDGVVDLIVGRQPGADELCDILAFTVDRLGRFYAVSNRTGAVHVFNPDGTLRHVCKPLPTDFSSNMLDADIKVACDGSVCLSAPGPLEGYLQFAADGRRVGVLKLADMLSGGEPRFEPNSGGRWMPGWQEVQLVGGGGQPSQTIRRRPDHNWLERVHGLGVAPDGSAAVCCEDSEWGFSNEPTICLYGPQGEPIRTIPLPFNKYIHRIAYDGKYIVLSRETDVLILDAEGKSIRRFAPAADRDKPYWEPFFSPDGKELWLHEQRTHVVRRYEALSF